MGQLFKNVASQKLRVFAFADAGHASLDPGEPVTGDAANISAYTAADNAALGASNDAAPAEVDATNAPGHYEFDPTQGETNGDVIEWYPKSSTAGVQVVTVGGSVQTTQPQYLPDLGIESDGHAHADLKQWLGVAPNALQSQRVDSYVGAKSASVGLSTQEAADVNTEADTALTDYDGPTKAEMDTAHGLLATEAKQDTAQTDLDVITDADGVILGAAGVDLIWDEVLTGATHNVKNSSGKRLRQIDAAFEVHSGTAQAGAATTITLDTGADATNDDIYRGDRIVIVAGTGAGEHGICISYASSTRIATMSESWVVTPDATSEFILVPADADMETWNHTAVTGDGDWAEMQTDLDAVLVDTGTTLPATLSTIDTVVDAIQVVTDALTAAAAAKQAAAALGIITGTVDTTVAATTTEFEADDITEATADHYNGRHIIFTSGILLGQETDITDYALAGGKGHFTVTALTEAPTNNMTFVIV